MKYPKPDHPTTYATRVLGRSARQILLGCACLGLSLCRSLCPGQGAGTGSPASPSGLPDDSTNPPGLYLTVSMNCTGPLACVSLHHTTNTLLYQLMSSSRLSDLAGRHGYCEGLLWGADQTNVTSTNLAVDPGGSRFFWARVLGPNTGQVLLTLSGGTSSLQAVVNGATNHYSAVASSVVTVPAPVSTLNLGYDHGDGGPVQIPDFAPQNVVAIDGLSDTLSTLCVSHNPLTGLDAHGLSGLQDIECYQCPNLAQVNVTNCPNLARACFEQCSVQGLLDFTGDANLQDIRAAVNHYTNVVFGEAGPRVWHLCVRDNPQLGQNLVLTNFYSLREWYMYNDSQTGAVTAASMPSTNLTDVQIENNHFECADFSGQSALANLLVYNNNLTNLLVDGCGQLAHLEGQGNQFSSPVLDRILTELAALGTASGYLDLSRNPERPSAIGYAAADELRTNLNWSVLLDGPGDGVAGDESALTFVVWSNTTVQLTLQTNAPASILWHWWDGSTDEGATSITHTFQGAPGAYPACHTNYVQVRPASALTYFGKQLGVSQGLVGVYGLSNFPALYEVYLYNDAVQQLSLANCGAVRQLHLADNPVSSTVCDQWFIDLDQAVPDPVDPNHNTLYYPEGAVTARSLAARASLTNKLWNLIPH